MSLHVVLRFAHVVLAAIVVGATVSYPLWIALAERRLYAVTLVVGFAVFGPVVRREIAALERGGVADPEYRRRRDRARLLTWFTILMLVAMLALMVFRPG